MHDYSVCPGTDLHACKSCNRLITDHQDAARQLAPVFALREPITPRIDGVRCYDFRTAPSSAPARTFR